MMSSMKACYLFATLHLFIGSVRPQDVSALFPAIFQMERDTTQGPGDHNTNRTTFDFIIIGAGAAGSALAHRLTEVEDWDVLLIEAGEEETAIMDIPMLTNFNNQDNFWSYQTPPTNNAYKSYLNQQAPYITGKAMGGGTAVNAMIAVRGSSHEYDNWKELGNPGWGYEDVLPYFRKLEDIQIPELRNSKYHSTEGKIKISYTPYESNFSSIFFQACEELGQPKIDYNGGDQTGCSRIQTTTANGTRWSASRGYLHPIRGRTNLYVKKSAVATKILINEKTKTAYGVNYTKGGKNYTVYAKKEVILSAGAIKSPQLLMLSGVGPKDVLKEQGIKVIKDSQVGYNVNDQALFLGQIYTIDNENVTPSKYEILSSTKHVYDYLINRNGPLTSNWYTHGISYWALENTPTYNPDWPNMAIAFYSSLLFDSESSALGFGFTEDTVREFWGPLLNKHSFTMVHLLLQPKSRGRLILNGNSIFTAPYYDANIFSHEDDLEVMVAGVRKARNLTQTAAFQGVGPKLYEVPIPACKEHELDSDEYWRCAVLQMSFPALHACGTAKMGPKTDKSAVVDNELKVYGIKRLRVVDASIFPTITTSNTMIPAYMVGEKGADLIKSSYNVK